jgi:hypothetical protein
MLCKGPLLRQKRLVWSPRVAHYVRKRFLSARTRPRFLPRNPARAEEENAKISGTPRDFFLSREKRKARKWRYANATMW